MDLADHVLSDIRFQYQKLREQAEKALKQVDDHQFHHFIDKESNNIALLVKHISGNMRSRWTNFLTEDGEKTSRNRPQEFDQDDSRKREEFMRSWNESWNILEDTLRSLSGADLMRTITIRGEKHSVVEALHRQLTHYAAHIGQLVFLAKHFNADNWQTLSIPRDTVQLKGGSYKG